MSAILSKTLLQAKMQKKTFKKQQIVISDLYDDGRFPLWCYLAKETFHVYLYSSDYCY